MKAVKTIKYLSDSVAKLGLVFCWNNRKAFYTLRDARTNDVVMAGLTLTTTRVLLANDYLATYDASQQIFKGF